MSANMDNTATPADDALLDELAAAQIANLVGLPDEGKDYRGESVEAKPQANPQDQTGPKQPRRGLAIPAETSVSSQPAPPEIDTTQTEEKQAHFESIDVQLAKPIESIRVETDEQAEPTADLPEEAATTMRVPAEKKSKVAHAIAELIAQTSATEETEPTDESQLDIAALLNATQATTADDNAMAPSDEALETDDFDTLLAMQDEVAEAAESENLAEELLEAQMAEEQAVFEQLESPETQPEKPDVFAALGDILGPEPKPELENHTQLIDVTLPADNIEPAAADEVEIPSLDEIPMASPAEPNETVSELIQQTDILTPAGPTAHEEIASEVSEVLQPEDIQRPQFKTNDNADENQPSKTQGMLMQMLIIITAITAGVLLYWLLW